MPELSVLLHDIHHRKHWRLLLLLLATVTAWFAFGPAPQGVQREGADKVEHLLAFASMACTGVLSLRPGWRGAAVATLGLLAYGAVIEIVQTGLPGRHGDWRDVLADMAGISTGLLIATLLRRWVRSESS